MSLRIDQRTGIGPVLHDISRLRRTAFDRRVRTFGLTSSQHQILSRFSRYGDAGMTQSDLAASLRLGKVALSGLLKKLERGAFIERHTDSSDRRIRRLLVTGAGKSVLEKISIVSTELHASILRGVPRERQRILVEALETIKLNLIQLDASRSETYRYKRKARGGS